MSKRKYFLSILVSLSLGVAIFTFSGCSLTDNESIVPAYLIIDDVKLSTNIDLQGVASEEINEVFVFADGVSLGVYPLPARIPVIVSGTQMNIVVGASIHPSGYKNSTVEYPFYGRESYNLDLESGKDYPIDVTFKYLNEAKFDFIESFENGSFFINDLDTLGSTKMEIASEGVLSNHSGVLSVDEFNYINEVGTENLFLRSNNLGSYTYLEFDYKNDIDYYVGVRYVEGTRLIKEQVYLFVPSEDWNHFYLDLTNWISSSTIESYSVFFG